jgi:Zn-dependent protease
LDTFASERETLLPIRSPLLIAYFIVSLIVSLACHEASHAFVADRLGDPTARRLGRLTLNPIAHIDPMGAIVLVISSLAGVGIGWGKPVPVNPYNLRRGILATLANGPLVGMALVAIAGPISNVILALLGVQVLALSPLPTGFVQSFVIVNVTLAVFNMIPIPPLDGFRVLVGILPAAPGYSLARLEPYGPGVLILLVFVGQPILGSILRFGTGPLLHLIGAY